MTDYSQKKILYKQMGSANWTVLHEETLRFPWVVAMAPDSLKFYVACWDDGGAHYWVSLLVFARANTGQPFGLQATLTQASGGEIYDGANSIIVSDDVGFERGESSS